MVAIAVIAGTVLAGAALQDRAVVTPVKPKPEKLCPITFHLFPSTSLQDRFARDIESANAQLAKDLVEWRTAKALLPGYEADRKTLIGRLQDTYAKTYLAHPVLWDEGGIPHVGWEPILEYLGTVLRKAAYIQPQSVNVYLEYLPPDLQTGAYLVGKRSLNLGAYQPGDVDFLAMIRTVIAYAPDDDPMEIGNESAIPHRKVCEPIY
jgi:hypothetical protein